MGERTVEAWKSSELTANYLEGVRGAVPLAGQQIEVMLRLAAATGQPVTRILDLGCGDGILGAALLQRYPKASGWLLDFSEPMLETAGHKLQGFGARAQTILADYGQPGWVEKVTGPFDVIVSGYSIHHQPHGRKRSLYAELYGLLRPGGLFVNVEHVASATPWLSRLFDEAFVDGLYAHELSRGGQRSREEVAQAHYYRPDKAANLLAPVEVQCQWLREIGFQDVDCYFKLWELAVFGGRRPEV